MTKYKIGDKVFVLSVGCYAQKLFQDKISAIKSNGEYIIYQTEKSICDYGEHQIAFKKEDLLKQYTKIINQKIKEAKEDE